MLQTNSRKSLMKKVGPKILIIGTLGAGKTTFSKYISSRMGLPFTGIDDCRRLYGDVLLSVNTGHGLSSLRFVVRLVEMFLNSPVEDRMYMPCGVHFYILKCLYM